MILPTCSVACKQYFHGFKSVAIFFFRINKSGAAIMDCKWLVLFLAFCHTILTEDGVQEVKYEDHVTCKRDFEKIGCFKEYHDATSYNLLITDKDSTSDAYQGLDLDWDRMQESIHSLACRCSALAREQGVEFFYIIHWGECWTSNRRTTLDAIKKSYSMSNECYNSDFVECDDEHPTECVAEGSNSVYLYKVKGVRGAEPVVDGGVSEWSEYSECSTTCGEGLKERVRSCTNPLPSGGGKGCDAPLEETAKCIVAKCEEEKVSPNIKVEETEKLELNDEMELTKGKLMAIMAKLHKEFSISFEVRPTKFVRGWHSILHMGLGGNVKVYGDCMPGLWFSNRGDGALHVCAAIGNNKDYCYNSKPVQLNQWLKVEISQQQLESKYVYSIHLNGELLGSVHNSKPQEFANVKVYTADPWYPAQPGSIRNLNIANGHSGILVRDERAIKRDSLVAMLPEMPIEYSVSFEVFPNTFKKGWHSVLHFTIDGNYIKYGDRVPGVWFHESKMGSLYICSPVNGASNRWFDTKPLPLKQWSKVHVSQAKSADGSFVYKVELNGEVILEEINRKPQVFKNVKVYTSDPWYLAQDGMVRNLVVLLGESEKPSPLNAVMNPEESVSMGGEGKFSRGKLLATLPELRKEYSVSFQIKPTSYHKKWQSVIHLTVNENYGTYGDRNPALFINYQGEPYFAGAVNGNLNYHFYGQPLKLNEWSTVRMYQYAVGTSHMFAVDVNGVTIGAYENNKAEAFENVKVYVSDPWYVEQPGSFRHLEVHNGNTEKVIGTNAIKPHKNLKLATIENWSPEFVVEFNMYLQSLQKGWHNVIDFNIGQSHDANGNSVPSVWTDYSGNGALHISSAVNNVVPNRFNTKPLSIKQWHNVLISQQHTIEHGYMYIVQIDGVVVRRMHNAKASSFKNVTVYAGSPWYNGADCLIKNFYFINGNKDGLQSSAVLLPLASINRPEEERISRNNLIGTLSLKKEYEISFELKPETYVKGWHSVLHLTTNHNKMYGSRIPAMWFKNTGSGHLYVCSDVSGRKSYYKYTKTAVPLNKWSKITISQKLVTVHKNAYYLTAKVDGVVALYVENKDAREFANVKVYLGDPWYLAQNAAVRNLSITTK